MPHLYGIYDSPKTMNPIGGVAGVTSVTKSTPTPASPHSVAARPPVPTMPSNSGDPSTTADPGINAEPSSGKATSIQVDSGSQVETSAQSDDSGQNALSSVASDDTTKGDPRASEPMNSSSQSVKVGPAIPTSSRPCRNSDLGQAVTKSEGLVQTSQVDAAIRTPPDSSTASDNDPAISRSLSVLSQGSVSASGPANQDSMNGKPDTPQSLVSPPTTKVKAGTEPLSIEGVSQALTKGSPAPTSGFTVGATTDSVDPAPQSALPQAHTRALPV